MQEEGWDNGVEDHKGHLDGAYCLLVTGGKRPLPYFRGGATFYKKNLTKSMYVSLYKHLITI